MRFMESEGSLLCSQLPATGSYPEAEKPSSNHHPCMLHDHPISTSLILSTQ